jgi:hypothetical protein
MLGPRGAFVLVIFEVLAGTFILMIVTMFFWRSISRGHYRATTWVLAPLTVAASFLVQEAQRFAAFALAGIAILFLLSVLTQRPLLEWITGIATMAGSIWLLFQLGDEPAHAFAGAFFVGSVTHGMILGHWYLNQPRLPIEPLKGATVLIFASIVPVLAVGLIDRSNLVTGSIQTGLFPFSAESFWWVWLGLIISTGLLAVMVWRTVWIRSTQSATGLLYLAMVPTLGAEFIISLMISR